MLMPGYNLALALTIKNVQPVFEGSLSVSVAIKFMASGFVIYCSVSFQPACIFLFHAAQLANSIVLRYNKNMQGGNICSLPSRKKPITSYKNEKGPLMQQDFTTLNDSDHLLSQQVLEGNLDAFTALYDQYEAALYRFVSGRVKDKDQIHDIVQQVFFKLYVCLPTLRTDRPLKPWLFTVAHHYCIDYLRHLQRNPTSVFSQLEILSDDNEHSPVALLLDSDPLPEDVVEYQELQRHVSIAMNRLPSHYRAIIVLRFFEHYSFREISGVLKMPENTVRAYYNRAKRLLKEDLMGHVLSTEC